MRRESYEHYIENLPFSQDQVGRWVGGVFEVGGCFELMRYITKYRGREYAYVYPTMSLGDEDTSFISRMKELFGGSTTPSDDHSLQWHLVGLRTRVISDLMAPYSPSRETIRLAIAQAELASPDEKIQIMEGTKEHNRFAAVQPQDYAALVGDPVFLAGVIETRGSFRKYRTPMMEVSSKNRALLEALKSKHGGSMSAGSLAGEKKRINDQEMEIRKDGYTWRTYKGRTLSLAYSILPYTLLKTAAIQEFVLRE